MRFAIVIAVIVTAGQAAADPAMRATIARADVFTAPGLTELRGELLRLGPMGNRHGFQLEAFTADLIDTSGGDRGDFFGNVAMRSAFLGARFDLERGMWAAWLAVHVGALWNNNIRYLLPSAGLRFGARDAITVAIEARPYSAFAASLDDNARRSLVRDLDLDARVAVPSVVPSLRVEARGRYRDITTEGEHLRDLFAAIGIAITPDRGDRYSFGSMFLGAGVRRVLDDDHLPETIERALEAQPHATWQFMVWLELDVRLVDHAPK